MSNDDLFDRPGTALASIIPRWAAAVTDGCGCKDYARRMDEWGVEGCREREDEIVEYLLSKSGLLIPPLALLPKSIRRNGARQLVKKAINLAS